VGIPLVTQADMEARFPPAHVRRVFSDDGSVTMGPRFDMIVDEASRQGEAILLRAFTRDQIATLVAEDAAVKGAFCKLVLAAGCEGRAEWSGQGAPYTGLYEKARQMLRDIADAELRSPAEAKAGANTTHLPRVQTAESPAFMYQSTRGNRSGGGF